MFSSASTSSSALGAGRARAFDLTLDDDEETATAAATTTTTTIAPNAAIRATSAALVEKAHPFFVQKAKLPKRSFEHPWVGTRSVTQAHKDAVRRWESGAHNHFLPLGDYFTISEIKSRGNYVGKWECCGTSATRSLSNLMPHFETCDAPSISDASLKALVLQDMRDIAARAKEKKELHLQDKSVRWRSRNSSLTWLDFPKWASDSASSRTWRTFS